MALALTTPQLLTGNARRLAQEGGVADAAERGVEIVRRSLTAEGPLTRGELRERLDETKSARRARRSCTS